MLGTFTLNRLRQNYLNTGGSELRYNKLGNVHIAYQSWRFRRNLIFDFYEWRQSDLSGAKNMWVGYLPGCLHHHRRFPAAWRVPTRRFPSWGLPTQSFPRSGSHVGLHVNCSLLLSDFYRNWNVFITFSNSPQFKTSWKSVVTCGQADLSNGYHMEKYCPSPSSSTLRDEVRGERRCNDRSDRANQ
jgi:hypothetical protein